MAASIAEWPVVSDVDRTAVARCGLCKTLSIGGFMDGANALHKEWCRSFTTDDDFVIGVLRTSGSVRALGNRRPYRDRNACSEQKPCNPFTTAFGAIQNENAGGCRRCRTTLRAGTC